MNWHNIDSLTAGQSFADGSSLISDVYDVMKQAETWDSFVINEYLSSTTEQECCVSIHNIIGDEH